MIEGVMDIYVGTVTLIGILVSVFFLTKTTNQNIKNNNKQTSRPYLRIDKITVLNETKPNEALEVLFDEYSLEEQSKNLDERTFTNKPVKLSLSLHNVGLGIARNIRMYNASKETSVFYETDFAESENVKNNNTYIDIAVSEEIDINIYPKYIREKPKEVNPHLKPVSDSCKFIIFYEDINNNLYSSTLRIDILYNLTRIHKDDPEFILSFETSKVNDHNKEKKYTTTKNSELDVWLTIDNHLK